MAAPSSYPTWATSDLIETVNGKSYSNKVPPTSELQLSGLKFQEPLARSIENYWKNNVYNWIVYFDEITTGGTVPLGWFTYEDTNLSSGSPLVVTTGTTVSLTNNAGSIISTSAPTTGATFYDGTYITADNEGDAYQISIQLTAEATAISSGFTVALDVDGTTLTADSRSIIQTSATQYTFDFTYVTDSDFVLNGATIQLTAIGADISVYDVFYTIQRTYYKSDV